MRILSVGEALWDVFPEQETLGGAPLNFAINSVRLGSEVALVSGVGDDERGERLLQAIASAGVNERYCRKVPGQPTGVALVGTNEQGEPTFAFPRPAAFDFLNLTDEQTHDLQQAFMPDWLYFGTLVQTSEPIEKTTRKLCEQLPGVRAFYDLNLREDCWTFPLVERLSSLASVVKLNKAEAHTLSACAGLKEESLGLEAFCAFWSEKFNLEAICVTLGADGCLLYQNGHTCTVPGFPVAVHDTVGAGDAFAAAFLHGFHHNWPLLETARFANALGSIVAGRNGATPMWSLSEGMASAGLTRSGVHDAH